MAEIRTPQGLLILLDDEDLPAMSAMNWRAVKAPRSSCFYAVSQVYDPSKQLCRTVYMHRLVTKAPRGVQVDHANRNGLDNRRDNLRLCSQGLNNANARAIGAASGYRGVYASHAPGRWRARIRINRRNHSLGSFGCPAEAARAYDKAAYQAFGEFASLNFPVAGTHLDGPHGLNPADRAPVVAAIRPLHGEGLGAQAHQKHNAVALNFSQ